MKTITIDWVKENGLLVFEAIAGSKAYGLDTPTSDTDIRGVFVLPKEKFYGLEYVEQVNNETNDIVYYELKRFIELLTKNNPNILELLAIPDSCILHKDGIMKRLKPEMFLSKLCEKTFANYAYMQIKKAYGLEKKILNPVDMERKVVLDFCFVYVDKDAIPLKDFLSDKNMLQESCGLASLPHMKNCYNLFYSEGVKYYGVVKNELSNDVSLSSIRKGEKPVAIMYFNKEGYSAYCKQYKEYWDWVAKRNEERYRTTMSHGKNYDSKNMMHVFRLLRMAKEIATDNCIHVYRNDREFLLGIKEGKYEYDDLVSQAEALKEELPELYNNSLLPDIPDMEAIDRLLFTMREDYYGSGK